MAVVIDTKTGETGEYSKWVEIFSTLWLDGQLSVDAFMDLLSPDVRLIAPGLRSTLGREAGQSAFRKTFAVLPDLIGKVLRWSASTRCALYRNDL